LLFHTLQPVATGIKGLSSTAKVNNNLSPFEAFSDPLFMADSVNCDSAFGASCSKQTRNVAFVEF
jgi:hypothetical protein